MEEKGKKALMITVALACLVAAGALTIWGRRDGRDLSAFKGQVMLLKCANDACGGLLEMDKKKYFEYQQKNFDPAILSAPPFTCPDCGEPSCLRAVKCAKCEEVFFYGTVEGTWRDTCPKCGFSSEKK